MEQNRASSAQGEGTAQPPPLLGLAGDDLWLWLPMPILAIAAALTAALGSETPRHVALQTLFLLNFLHLGATWTRLYGDARRDHPVAAYVLPGGLLAFTTFMLYVQLEGLLLLMVFFINIPHIGLQNYGLIQVAAQQSGPTTPWQRGLDKAYQLFIPLALALWFASRPGASLFGSQAIGLDRLPAPILATVGAAAIGLGLVTFAAMIYAARDGHAVPRERWALHLAYGPGMAACFYFLPPELAPIPVAGTHYIQYLVVVRRFHRRAGVLDGSPNVWARVHPAVYLLLLALLAPGIPLVVNTALAPVFGALIPAIGAAASLHHFLADGLIWKLREARTRRLMIGGA